MLVVCQYSKKPSPSPPPIKKVGGGVGEGVKVYGCTV